MFHWKSWNRIPAYKFGYGWKPIFKCFLSQRIKRIDLNTPIFFSVRDQFQKKIWEQDSNKWAIFRSTVFVLEDFETFQKSPCAGDFFPVCALCGGTLKNFEKFPIGISHLCVGFLVCGVWKLWKFSKFPCVWALCYIGTLPVNFCIEICSAFFDGTCSFFYFFEWNWNFFCFCG